MSRLDIDTYLISMAYAASLRGTCPRRSVGCVVVDRNNNILGTGMNGNPSGQDHCIDSPCPGADLQSGSGLDKCEAIHAEINALMRCSSVKEVYKIYTTTSPCIHCVKALLATNCQEIVFKEEYPHSESKIMWEKSNRIWRKLL